ncbi:MAG: hypothetical protein ACTSXH_14085 [Promethearchaeota archaeon]
MIILKYKFKEPLGQIQLTDYIFSMKKITFMMIIQRDHRTAMKLIKKAPRRPKRKKVKKKSNH